MTKPQKKEWQKDIVLAELRGDEVWERSLDI